MNTTHTALEFYEIHVKESLSLFVCLFSFVLFSFLFCFVLYFIIIILFYFFKNNKEVEHYIATSGES